MCKGDAPVEERTQNDRRSVRTMDAIQNVFVALILKKGFDAIRVSDIVTGAGLNRGTFYLHYADKYDLLEKTEASVLNDLKSLTVRAKRLNDLSSSAAEAFDRNFTQIADYMKRNADLMRALFTLEGKYSLRHKLCGLLDECFHAGLYPLRKSDVQIPSKYWIIYIFSADIGVLEAWLNDGCKEPTAEIVRVLSLMIQRGGYSVSTE